MDLPVLAGKAHWARNVSRVDKFCLNRIWFSLWKLNLKVGMSITRVFCYPGIESKIFNYPGTRVPDSGNTFFQKIANFPFKQRKITEKYIILKIVEIENTNLDWETLFKINLWRRLVSFCYIRKRYSYKKRTQMFSHTAAVFRRRKMWGNVLAINIFQEDRSHKYSV
jgi:hypothetical protein